MASRAARFVPGIDRVTLFGGVAAWHGRVELPLGGAKPRAVLAALVMAAPHPLDRSSLIDAVWGETLPTDPARDLRRIVHDLRSVLGDAAIVTHAGGGYRSTIARNLIDVSELERAVAVAHREDVDRVTAGEALALAIAATAGEPLAGVVGGHGALSGLARSLSELRTEAQDMLAELLLMSGRAGAAVGLLEELVAATPLHEERWALLMTALAVTGRRSDALRCYQRARDVLVSTVGVEPGTRLRAVETAVLNDDFAVTASRSTAGASDRSDVTDLPVTRYVDVGGSAVAYQVWGTGPLDIVLVPQLVSHLEAMLDLPGYRAWIEGLASIGTLLVFDKRGNGLSDRLVCALTIDERIADIAAVMDAAGMPRAALVGTSEGGTLALRFAAAQPDRVTCVVAAGATAAGRYATGRISEDAHKDMVRRIRETWGTGQDWWMYELAAPSLRQAPLAVRRHYEQMNRMSSSPTTAAFLWDLYGRMDIRPLLSDVRCPVLVQHRVAESLAWASADLLEGLPHAEQALVPGSDHPVWVGDVDAYLAPIRTFLANHAPPAR